jgi:hypothetical protein
VFVILCAAFINRVKKHGLPRTLRYCLKQLFK